MSYLDKRVFPTSGRLDGEVGVHSITLVNNIPTFTLTIQGSDATFTLDDVQDGKYTKVKAAGGAEYVISNNKFTISIEGVDVEYSINEDQTEVYSPDIVDVGTNLITEYNISSLLNSICDYSDDSSYNCGFVITKKDSSSQDGDIPFLESGETSNDIEFIIRGYYFKIKDFNPNNGSSWTTQYVKIILNPENNSEILATINIINNAAPESYHYLDHVVDNNWGTSGIERSLLILKKKSDNVWYIPGESRIRFKGYSLSGLDEGTL